MVLIQKVEIKDCVHDGSQLVSKDLSDQQTRHKSILWMFRGPIIQTIKIEHWPDSEG